MAAIAPITTLEQNMNNQNNKQQQQHYPSDHDEHLLYARIRLATESDVPFVNKLIHKMAAFYELSDECEANETSLYTALFGSRQPPLKPFSPTVSVFLLEVSPIPLPPLQPSKNDDDISNLVDHIYKTVSLTQPINDPEESLFRTKQGTIIAGFAIFFPSYSTFLTKPGIHLEDLFIRKGYRSKGFGSLLIKAVANLTVKLGYARVEWTVITWNVGSHRFYEKMGAHLLQDWRIFRLDGDSLLSFGHLN